MSGLQSVTGTRGRCLRADTPTSMLLIQYLEGVLLQHVQYADISMFNNTVILSSYDKVLLWHQLKFQRECGLGASLDLEALVGLVNLDTTSANSAQVCLLFPA